AKSSHQPPIVAPPMIHLHTPGASTTPTNRTYLLIFSYLEIPSYMTLTIISTRFIQEYVHNGVR
ncbi:MAG: hypothetical protein ACFFG0_54960, partial [Candidatus Thorarchaeota archaeon]